MYTGITTDLARRLGEHQGDNNRGARYTRTRRPLELVYWEQAADRSNAAKREAALKRLSRTDKLALLGMALTALPGTAHPAADIMPPNTAG